MGEIATWSAVKTKVGLGKDSNECPTKAELLALSPTGTGENYVGLEISNASSYGNNETVQLSDIHKVTYKYTFTVDRTTLSFPASGGALSSNLGFGLVSRKQKYVDGVISGSYTKVGYTQTAYPDWVSYNQTVPQYEAKENTGLVERSANMTFTQNESGKQITVQFTQDAATISTRYEISWTANYSNGTVEENVTEVELEGTTGMENSVRMDLHILEYTSINGVEGTPTSWDSRAIAENNSAIASPSSQVSATLQSDSENAFIGITNSVQNLAEYPRTHTITLYNPKVVINGKEIGTVPTITLLVNPIPYTRVFEFGWKQEGSTITNITLEGDIYGSSAGSRDIISYASLRRNNVEFAKKYIKPTFIPPSEDWLQVIDNGQNSDNSYNWAFKALTNNKGDSARNQQVRFEQPGNGNQALYAYVSQDPVATELNCELGNYYSYGASDIVNIGFGWSSRDGGDTTDRGGMNTPGGYLGARISLPAENDRIDMYAVGLPTYGKPLKIKLSNIRKVKKISYGNNQYTGLSVGYSQQDYKLGIVMSVGMESYFQLTPSILSESGEYGGGIQIQVTLKQTYNGYSGHSMADITLTPKDSNLPTLYLNIAWGNP